jgi:hypothetical protein
VSLVDPAGIASALDRLAAPGTLAVAKSAAFHLGRERYNWDIEKSIMLGAVASAFAQQGRKHT